MRARSSNRVAAICGEGGSRPLELLFKLRAGERLKSAKRFAGGWVNGRDRNGRISSLLIIQHRRIADLDQARPYVPAPIRRPVIPTSFLVTPPAETDRNLASFVLLFGRPVW